MYRSSFIFGISSIVKPFFIRLGWEKTSVLIPSLERCNRPLILCFYLCQSICRYIYLIPCNLIPLVITNCRFSLGWFRLGYWLFAVEIRNTTVWISETSLRFEFNSIISLCVFHEPIFDPLRLLIILHHTLLTQGRLHTLHPITNPIILFLGLKHSFLLYWFDDLTEAMFWFLYWFMA